MLSKVKMLLRGEVGGCALNSHGNYIVDHGKSWNCVFEFLWEPCHMISFMVFHYVSGEKLGASEDKLVLSASIDCSIKVWSANTGTGC